MPFRASRVITPNTSLTIVGSRAEVGSSKSRISGSMARARAMATRCFCPPESWSGMASARSASPTMSSSWHAFCSASSRLLPSSCMGEKVMLSSTDIPLNRLNDWNTMPMRRRSRGTSASGARMSCPSMRILPLVGCSNRFRQRRKVLLPVPEGPIMEMTSPRCTSRLMSRSTSNVSKLFFRCDMRMRSAPCPAPAVVRLGCDVGRRLRRSMNQAPLPIKIRRRTTAPRSIPLPSPSGRGWE